MSSTVIAMQSTLRLRSRVQVVVAADDAGLVRPRERSVMRAT